MRRSTIQPTTFGSVLPGGARVIAISPTFDRPYGSVDVHAITPSGRRISLLLLSAARPEWRRRYWLDDTVALPPGTKIETTLSPPFVDPADPPPPKGDPLRISLDLVGS